MGISVDGNSLTVTDCTITFNNAFDASTGMATITITPSGGLGTLPGVLDGQPGLPPNINVGAVTTLAPGSAATAALALMAPGGPGAASTYSLNLGIPQGAAGAPSVFSIQGAEDLIGSLVNGIILVWDELTGQFKATPPPLAVTVNASSINSTSGDGAGPRLLSQVNIPAQSWAWTPQPSASCVVTGTANTQVNLQAFITNNQGQQVGIGYGVPGFANQTVSLGPGVPVGMQPGYGQVAAGVSANILLYATQVGSNTDAWSTSDLTTSFQVTAQPVQVST